MERWGRTLGTRDRIGDGVWCVTCLDYEYLPDRRSDQLMDELREYARALPKDTFDVWQEEVLRQVGPRGENVGPDFPAGGAAFADRLVAQQGRRPTMSGNAQDYHYTYPITAALACAVALGVVLFMVAIARALITDPDLITPAADQAEQTATRPVGPGQFPTDLAWPLYPFRQSRADIGATWQNSSGTTPPCGGHRPAGSSATPRAGGCYSPSPRSSSRG